MSEKSHKRVRQQAMQRQDTGNVGEAPSLVQTLRMEAFMGPMPPPNELANYEAILPGCAERMLAIVEKQWELTESQSQHRQLLEKMALQSEVYQAKWGLWSGLTVAIVGLVAAVIMAVIGQPAVAGVVGSIDIVGLVSVFVYGSHIRKSERIEKTKILTGHKEA